MTTTAPTKPAKPIVTRKRNRGRDSLWTVLAWVIGIGFFFPVVAKGQARIRTQMSTAHTREHLDKAIAAFIKVGKKLEVI